MQYAFLIGLGFVLYRWFIVKEAVDKVAADDSVGQLIVIASILPVFLLFYFLRLKTEIDERGIHFQFLPFQFSKKTILWNDMENCHVRTYNAIKEFGGWGYRTSFGRGGKAYNVKGDKGIQIVLKTGKKILIGTQKEADAKEVINRYLKKRNEGV